MSLSRFPITLTHDPTLTCNSCMRHLLKTKIFCNSSVTPAIFAERIGSLRFIDIFTSHFFKNTINIRLARQFKNKLLS